MLICLKSSVTFLAHNRFLSPTVCNRPVPILVHVDTATFLIHCWLGTILPVVVDKRKIVGPCKCAIRYPFVETYPGLSGSVSEVFVMTSDEALNIIAFIAIGD